MIAQTGVNAQGPAQQKHHCFVAEADPPVVLFHGNRLGVHDCSGDIYDKNTIFT